MLVTAVGSALPQHHHSQEELLVALRAHWSQRHHNVERLETLHRHLLVGGRYLALPLEQYARLTSFGEANDAWIRVGLEVGEAAVREALEAAAVPVERIGAFFFTTVTGVASPSLDARLLNRLPLPRSVRRVPMFGLGCVAGTAGIARAADFVRAWPDQAALLLSVELCSLTLQRNDLSVANLIASGLFGDGAACAVVVGEALAAERPRPGAPRVLATRSTFYPDTERLMGWDISEEGFRIVLSAQVPVLVQERLRGDVDGFLAEQGLTRADVDVWVAHPGGPRVLEAMQEALELPPEALRLSWESLREVGNLSSASVLLVLRETMRRSPPPGSRGLMVALGPGFCSELVLLQW